MAPREITEEEVQVSRAASPVADIEVPSFSYKNLHMYRRIGDIIGLKPVNHVFVYDHVRLVGTYHYDYINSDSKYKSNFIKDRFTDDKILVSLDAVRRSPMLDTVILLLGVIKYKRVYTANTFQLVPYILIRFWYIVLDPHIERKLREKSNTIPDEIYNQTEHYIQNSFLDPADCGVLDNGDGYLIDTRM